MPNTRLPALVPLLALCAGLTAEGVPTPAPTLTPEQQQAWEELKASEGHSPDAIAAEAKYVEARALYQAARFVEARAAVDAALLRYPPHRAAQALREDILAVLSLRDNRLKQATTWLGSIQDVKTQETAVRLAARLNEGDRKMAAKDYAGAELAYDGVDIALRTFPYQFDWGNLPEQVATKKLEARAKDRQAQVERQREDRARAAKIAEEKREAGEAALSAKVDEMLRRAEVAYSRQDYKRAEVDAWNAYELDRRREDARTLYLKARRKGHEQFDATFREERLERLTRVHELVHQSLIPQTELLVYPEDWQKRAQRTPPDIGTGKEEPWLASIEEQMNEIITFDFEDAAFEDVMAFFRQVTGLTIIVAPNVYANGAPPITLKATNMRFREALKWVLEMGNLHSAIQNQAIFISNEPIAGAVVLRMYDVADLISPVRDLPGRELAYTTGGSGGGGGGGFDIFKGTEVEEGEATDPVDLVDFIQKNVAPDRWTGDGIAAENRGTTIFVSQTPEVQEQIVALLKEQRNQSRLQVHVNVRLLNVSKGFFEEIGFEFHNAPVGLLGATSTAGYIRQNDSEFYAGSLRNPLPGNTSLQAPAGLLGVPGATGARGLQIEGSWNLSSFLGIDQVNALFAAAEAENDAQVLQHPAITCFNGQRAHATFMNQYAYISDYEVVNDNLDPVISVLTYGDILDVKPFVSADRKYITMEIRPSSVSLQGVFVELISAPRIIHLGNTGQVIPSLPYPIELPNVLVRTLRSTVMLPDKGSLLIGGFNRTLRQRVHSGVPFLSHIPFLGRLFSRNGNYDENSKLFFLLNAEIIDLGEREELH